MSRFGDWRDQRSAMEEAYAEIGEPEKKDPNVSIPEREWKLVEKTLKHYGPLHWVCHSCHTDLSPFTMIRCADCKIVFCERCVRSHFKSEDFPKDL